MFHKTKTQQAQYHRAIKKTVLDPLQRNIVNRLSQAPSIASAWQAIFNAAFQSLAYQNHLDGNVPPLALGTINQLSAWHEKKTKTQFQKVFGVDVLPFLNENQTKTALQPHITRNIALIKRIPQDLNAKVNENFQKIVFDQGFSEDVMLDMLTQRFKVASSHAQLIARDQVGKTIGALTKIRHAQAGIKQYVWRTSDDERVRESHQVLEGNLFSWSSPPAIGHPGQPIQCRCTAEPYIPGVSDLAA